MTYEVCQVTPSEVPVLKALIHVFGEAFDDVDAYGRAVPSDAYLRSLLAKPHFIVLVAREGDEVIGGLAAYELEKFEQERREMYIYDLAVSAQHRRKGVATRLINELRRIAAHRGAYVIFVQADRGDTAAIALYESLGTKEDVYHFDITVGSHTRAD